METALSGSGVKQKAVESDGKGMIWSYSKMSFLDTCPRKFYYAYYGSKKRTAMHDPDKDMALFLKGMHTGSTLVGDIVHFLIRTHLKKKKNGIIWDLQRLQSFGYNLLKNAIKYSAELRDNIFEQYKFPPRILLEVYYGEATPYIIRNQLREQINRLLEVYYSTTAFDHLRAGALLPGSIVEQSSKFFYGGFRVDGIIDLLFDDGDYIIIADWKTGDVVVEDTSLQLLTYAIWAMETKGIPANRIKLQKAYLENGQLEELEFSAQHIKRAKARMIQDIEILKELEDFGNQGVIEAFSCCLQEKVCRLCSFKKICTKI